MTENKSSARVLEKLGFKEVGKGFIFSISRNEKVSDIKLELDIIWEYNINKYINTVT